MWVVVLVAAAAAVAAYEWLKPPAGGALALPPGLGGALKKTPLTLASSPIPQTTPLAPSAVSSLVPGARSWVMNVAHAGLNISAAGDSLVRAIVLIANTFGTQALPSSVRQVADYGLIAGVDWPLGIPTDAAAQASPYYNANQARGPGRAGA